MVWATVGSSTTIFWKRRSSAASFSRCLRYSSSVVAPIVCSSPRASIGLRIEAASIAPLAAPAPPERGPRADEQDNVAAGLVFLGALFEPLPEVPAVAGAGDQRTEVEGVDLLVLQRLRHVAADDRL